MLHSKISPYTGELMHNINIRTAVSADLPLILNIYNQGIEDRIATLEQDLKEMSDIEIWFQEHQGRYSVLVAESKGEIVGWASLNPYSHRCACKGVADLSVYVDRAFRGNGIGGLLLQALEKKQLKRIIFIKSSFLHFHLMRLGKDYTIKWATGKLAPLKIKEF